MNIYSEWKTAIKLFRINLCAVFYAVFLMRSLLCARIYAVCSMRSSMPSFLCALLYALFYMRCSICAVLYAVFSMRSSIFGLYYALFIMRSVLFALFYTLFYAENDIRKNIRDKKSSFLLSSFIPEMRSIVWHTIWVWHQIVLYVMWLTKLHQTDRISFMSSQENMI